MSSSILRLVLQPRSVVSGVVLPVVAPADVRAAGADGGTEVEPSPGRTPGSMGG